MMLRQGKAVCSLANIGSTSLAPHVALGIRPFRKTVPRGRRNAVLQHAVGSRRCSEWQRLRNHS